MTAITTTDMSGAGQRSVSVATLNGSGDTFTYIEARRAILYLHNPTGGAISPTIDGAGGTTVNVPGIGTVDVSGGYAVGSIAAGATVAIPVDTIREYLQGTIAITGGTGLEASYLEY